MTDDLTTRTETPRANQLTSAATPNASAGAPTAPVSPPRGASRMRWFLAFGIVGLAVAVTIGAFALLGAPATPAALRYIPDDAVAVVEIRMDLPGDQMENLGDLLAHFPGFADQSTLTDKIDEAMQQLVAGAGSGGDTDYRTDVKPWLNGPLFAGAFAPDGNLSTEGSDEMVVSATTNGAVDCVAAFDGQTVTHETYQGLDLSLSGDARFACVVDGRQALVGTPAQVKRAIDAKAAGTGMDKSARYAAARAALGGDRLASVYVDGEALAGLAPTASAMPVPGLDALAGQVPDWIMAGIRAESDALVIDTVAAPVPASTAGPSLLPMPAGHASVLAGVVPADSLLFVEAQGAGVAIQNLFTQLGQIPDAAPALQMLEGLGGASELAGWIQDAGISVAIRDTKPQVAILLVGADEASTTSRVTSLRSLLGLMAVGGDGVTIEETTVNGVAVTTATITDISALVPPGSVPGMEDLTGAGPFTFSIAGRGNTLLLAVGAGAMASVLNVAAGAGLGDDATFKAAGARGLSNSPMSVYVAAGASVELMKGFLSPAELEKFRTEAAPYLEPLDAVLITTSMGSDANRSRIVVTVSKPAANQ
jgi:hypothetical protein